MQQARSVREANYKTNPEVRTKLKVRWAEKVKQEKAHAENINYVIDIFLQKISEMPCYTCCVCTRFRFRSQVQKFTTTKYSEHCIRITVDPQLTQEWICFPCHQSLSKDKIPPLSVVGNRLKPLTMPGELENLNTLEQFLITPVLPFMKIISLLKGCQRGMHGPVVCVASNICETVKCLPRTIDNRSLIKVKLKRKLAYKGHHLYQPVRPNMVSNALHSLKEHHPAMKGIVSVFTIVFLEKAKML